MNCNFVELCHIISIQNDEGDYEVRTSKKFSIADDGTACHKQWIASWARSLASFTGNRSKKCFTKSSGGRRMPWTILPREKSDDEQLGSPEKWNVNGQRELRNGLKRVDGVSHFRR